MMANMVVTPAIVDALKVLYTVRRNLSRTVTCCSVTFLRSKALHHCMMLLLANH